MTSDHDEAGGMKILTPDKKKLQRSATPTAARLAKLVQSRIKKDTPHPMILSGPLAF
jgi:hypothetical protein